MSKELEAFYCILNNDYDSDERYKLAVNNVEDGLKRLEAIDNANTTEALEWLKQQAIAFEHSELAIEVANENYASIKQALLKAQEQEKVLSIIFEKNVDIYNLKTCISLEHYNSEIRRKNQNNTYSYEIWYELTQEEFESVKRYRNKIKDKSE